MCLPYDSLFLHKIATETDVDAFEFLVDNASLTEIYSVVKVLRQIDAVPKVLLSGFQKNTSCVKASLKVNKTVTQRNVCAALACFYTREGLKR